MQAQQDAGAQRRRERFDGLAQQRRFLAEDGGDLRRGGCLVRPKILQEDLVEVLDGVEGDDLPPSPDAPAAELIHGPMVRGGDQEAPHGDDWPLFHMTEDTHEDILCEVPRLFEAEVECGYQIAKDAPVIPRVDLVAFIRRRFWHSQTTCILVQWFPPGYHERILL